MAGADILQFPQPFAGVATPPPDSAAGPLHELADLQFCNRLHGFLDIDPLLEHFLEETATWQPVTGLCYTAPGLRELFIAGRATRQVVRARLHFGTACLGEIELQLSGELRISPDALLAPLAAPLHNALLHHRVKLLARKDSLTGLGNRMALDATLATEVARAQRFGHPFSLLIIDIDHFKHINDAFGHSAGDQVIRAVAAELAECLRPYDQAFRYGGEEFVVLLSETGIAKGRQIAERIRRRIAVRCKPQANPGHKVTVSTGAGEFLRTETLGELFDRVDRALYRAKSEGRNRVIAAD
jgi:diguanylate cyclase (GGDEF)-like protein